MTPSILIVHPDRKAQRTMQRVLGSTGYVIDVVDDVAHARSRIEAAAPALVVVDGALLSDEVTALFEAARARGVEACMTLQGLGDDKIPAILTTGSITNLLSHAMPVLADELTITVQKLVRRDLFGAEKYLLWGTHLREVTLERASQRNGVVAELAEAVKARGQSARVASMAMLIADELLSNAVHNAPVDAEGRHYRADLPRDQELALDGRHRVRMRWGCDARYLAIEVRDHFGSLTRETIMTSLAKDSVRETGGGAGMGVALAYRSSDHLVFNLHPGTCTEIVALIDVRNPPTERAGASSYNIFVERTP